MASSPAQRTSCKGASVTGLNGKEHGDVQEEGQRAGSSKSNLGSAPQSTCCMLMQARMELQAQLPAPYLHLIAVPFVQVGGLKRFHSKILRDFASSRIECFPHHLLQTSRGIYSDAAGLRHCWKLFHTVLPKPRQHTATQFAFTKAVLANLCLQLLLIKCEYLFHSLEA